jgi:hypothetical protein
MEEQPGLPLNQNTFGFEQFKEEDWMRMSSKTDERIGLRVVLRCDEPVMEEASF